MKISRKNIDIWLLLKNWRFGMPGLTRVIEAAIPITCDGPALCRVPEPLSHYYYYYILHTKVESIAIYHHACTISL